MDNGAGIITEREWQFDALDLGAVQRWLAASKETSATVTSLQPIAATSTKRLLDVYVDTDDWRIGRAGYSLRMRRTGKRTEVTLKSRDKASGGFRVRLEVTQPLPEPSLDRLDLSGPVGTRVRALVGFRSLHSLVEVRTLRTIYPLVIGDAVAAELALDETVITVLEPRRRMPLRRVEVEVAEEHISILRPFIAAMQAACALQPASLSKFEAGLLLAGMHTPDQPAIGPTEINPGSSLGDLTFAVMRRELAALLEHEPGTRLGEDPEELHQMRVATRRLRAAMETFREVLPARASFLYEEVGWLAKVLGHVRDLDVQMQDLSLQKARPGLIEPEGFEQIDAHLQRARHHGRQELLAALDSKRYDRLITSMSAMLTAGPLRRSLHGRSPAAIELPALIEQRHEIARKAARKAHRTGFAKDFHKLRICCKRLRYAVEFASDVYPGQTRRYALQLARLQGQLGAMQDAEVAADRFLNLIRSEDDPDFAAPAYFSIGILSERYWRTSQRRLRRLRDQTDQLSGTGWKKLVVAMNRSRDALIVELRPRTVHTIRTIEPVLETPTQSVENAEAPPIAPIGLRSGTHENT